MRSEIGFWFQFISVKINVLKAVWYYWDGKQNSGLLSTLRSKKKSEAMVLPFALNKALKSLEVELDSKKTSVIELYSHKVNSECSCSHNVLRIFS